MSFENYAATLYFAKCLPAFSCLNPPKNPGDVRGVLEGVVMPTWGKGPEGQLGGALA